MPLDAMALLFSSRFLGQEMQVLSGWKEIANHMQRGVRTLQRWERAGLPIHRPKLGQSTAVIAFAEELDAWMEAAPIRKDLIRDLQAKVASLEAQVRTLESRLAHPDTTGNSNGRMPESVQEMKDRATGMIQPTGETRKQSESQRRTD